ncbi:hypothetical protein DM02DRAFT_267018 [Periconia macrospinosa]|uniref:Uncharacterized protein n=1 Tax=Periconia macrospinosa TaxID=97972 RepID=A0A2V1D5C2_9PLEO|nr:hypothetical protein DM02DRAFT_267018 [Periconia macrospinosa]
MYTYADRMNEAIGKNNDLIGLLRNLSTHVDDVGKKMIDEHLNSLREDDYTPAPVTKLKAGALGASEKRSGEHSLPHEGNRAPSPTELNTCESFKDDAIDALNENLLRNQKSRAKIWCPRRNMSDIFAKILYLRFRMPAPISGHEPDQSIEVCLSFYVAFSASPRYKLAQRRPIKLRHSRIWFPSILLRNNFFTFYQTDSSYTR